MKKLSALVLKNPYQHQHYLPAHKAIAISKELLNKRLSAKNSLLVGNKIWIFSLRVKLKTPTLSHKVRRYHFLLDFSTLLPTILS
jgi:hypothetical protein